MKATPGIGAAVVSGALGAVVGERSGHGQRFRATTFHVTRPSPASRVRPVRLAHLAKKWRTLTPAQRLHWDAWAQARGPSPARIGQGSSAGFHAYIEANMFLLEAALAEIVTPPVFATLGAPSFLQGLISVGGASLVLGISASGPAGLRRLCYSSAPLPPGRHQFSGQPLKQLFNASSNATANRWANFVGNWGDLDPSYGSYQVLLRCVLVTSQGQHSAPFEQLLTLAA